MNKKCWPTHPEALSGAVLAAAVARVWVWDLTSGSGHMSLSEEHSSYMKGMKPWGTGEGGFQVQRPGFQAGRPACDPGRVIRRPSVVSPDRPHPCGAVG